jgi:hypothetical protein
MKIAIMFILLLTPLFPSIVHSGEIFGCIKLGKNFIGKGVTIEIKPEDKTKLIEIIETDVNLLKIKNPLQTVEIQPKPIGTTKTDEYGTYRLSVPETGSCILNMKYKERPVYTSVSKEEKKPDFLVYFYKGSVQYDFFIEEKDGEYLLRRK